MKPILSNAEMVRAILDGSKRVTRRVVKPQPSPFETNPHKVCENIGNETYFYFDCPGLSGVGPYKISFRVGDILYVQETWAKCGNEKAGRPMHYEYRADCKNPIYFSDGFMASWRSPIYMPKEAARLFLRVTDVRVERLLTPFFAPGAAIMELRKEGITLPGDCAECIENYGNPCCIDAEEDSECGILDEVRGEFSELWDSTIKKADLPRYGWNANPWVWVIEFERISKETAKKEGDAP